MTAIEFDAFDYRADGSFAPARYRFDGDPATGYRVSRDGGEVLRLGPGYRALRVLQCGVCSTDLARHHLPFPLPQVIGHEVVAVDADGRRYVVEINASHAARGIAHDCAFCAAGLATHCPDRLTLGIHDLPGGFGAWILAPVAACLPIPADVDDATAVLVEPLAAALHAVTTVAPRPGERIAVLGPRRLGLLVVAALAAVRDRAVATSRFEVAAIVRDPALAPVAAGLGADTTHVVGRAADPALARAFDVVVDTTGSPRGLDDAVGYARREVHLKSTHGQPAGGLRHTTAMVVDELSLAPLERALAPGRGLQIAWLAAAEPDAAVRAAHDVRRGSPTDLAAHYLSRPGSLGGADVAVVDSPAGVDAAVRPVGDSERALVRPRGVVAWHPDGDVGASPLLAAVATRGLGLSTSRCGDFRHALQLLASSPALRGLGERFVTHRFPAAALPQAFAVAASRGCIKAVVEHAPARA